jgi:signal transduction histidine kinase
VDIADRIRDPELRRQIAESFHRQHVAATGRLLASVAHDVRSALSSIVYSADFLDERGGALEYDVLRATARDIAEVSRRLSLTVDSLLDYARLGPSISVPVSLREVMSRAQGLLRSFYRDGAHGLRVEILAGAEWVRGNPVVVEQIFVNLLLSAAEHAAAPSLVIVTAQNASSPLSMNGGVVETRVQSDRPPARKAGPSAPRQPDDEDATLSQLSLRDAEAAAVAQGGQLLLEEKADALSFVVRLPRSEGPR